MKKAKKVELKKGQIWGVSPIEKTLEIRTITRWYDRDSSLEYATIGEEGWPISQGVFRSWITRKKAVLIGHYNFKTGKAVSVKGGKR